VREKAARKITDQVLIAEIAGNDGVNYVRKAAMEKNRPGAAF